MSMIIGSHVEVSGTEMLLGAVKKAIDYGATTFMFYTGAPQNSIRKDISLFNMEEAHELMAKHNINPDNVIVHAPYIINVANSSNSETREIGIRFLRNEIDRTFKLGMKTLVLHPGAHVGMGIEKGIETLINSLNEVLDVDETDVKIAIETMAGKGSEIGFTFEQVKSILDGINKKDRVGVCLDTCHINDAGYDIVNHYDEVIGEFDRIIGLDKLIVIHLNDSKNPLGAKKDRHENIGYGFIGYETIVKFAHDERFKDIPKILETPYYLEKPLYKEEIEMIKKKEFVRIKEQEPAFK